jgi:ribose 5-phosphate isomerase B
MKIAIGSDRRGFDYKSKLTKYLKKNGYEVLDVGPYDDKLPVDYPIYGQKVGIEVAAGNCEFGVVICATGNGIMIAANKVKGVRCGMGYDDDVASLLRKHNDANVIAFGQNHMKYEDVEKRLNIFLHTDFLSDYHCARIEQISKIEDNKPIKQSLFLNEVLDK